MRPEDRPGSAVPILRHMAQRRCAVLLREIPFVVPFDDRVSLFRSKIYDVTPDSFGGYYRSATVPVRRTSVYADTFNAVMRMQSADELRGRWSVSFTNAEGLDEAGVDGGGLFKELLTMLVPSAFTEHGLFLTTETHELYPNPASHVAVDEHLAHFRFLGRIVGKALWEGLV
jgi:ubiquitin-protein ligase E3 C